MATASPGRLPNFGNTRSQNMSTLLFPASPKAGETALCGQNHPEA